MVKQLKVLVQQGYDQEEDDFEIQQNIKKDFTKYQNWAGFNFMFGKHVGKMYQEIEALAWEKDN